MDRTLTNTTVAFVALALIGIGACDTSSSGAVKPICNAAAAPISRGFATIRVGDTLRLSVGAFLDPCTGAGPNVPRWTSSATTVASVDAVSGLVTALGAGTAVIAASAVSNQSLSTMAIIQVTK